MKDLVEKFWNGECSLEEQKFLLQKLEGSSQLKDDALNAYHRAIIDRKDKDVEYYNNLFLKIKGQIEVFQEQKRPKYLYRLVSFSAAAMVLIVGTLFFFN